MTSAVGIVWTFSCPSVKLTFQEYENICQVVLADSPSIPQIWAGETSTPLLWLLVGMFSLLRRLLHWSSENGRGNRKGHTVINKMFSRHFFLFFSILEVHKNVSVIFAMHVLMSMKTKTEMWTTHFMLFFTDVEKTVVALLGKHHAEDLYIYTPSTTFLWSWGSSLKTVCLPFPIIFFCPHKWAKIHWFSFLESLPNMYKTWDLFFH